MYFQNSLLHFTSLQKTIHVILTLLKTKLWAIQTDVINSLPAKDKEHKK